MLPALRLLPAWRERGYSSWGVARGSRVDRFPALLRDTRSIHAATFRPLARCQDERWAFVWQADPDRAPRWAACASGDRRRTAAGALDCAGSGTPKPGGRI